MDMMPPARTLTRENVGDAIARVFADVWRSHMNSEPPVLARETLLLETGMDSIGFAILVAELDAELGYDPFSLSTEVYYPQSFGEFVDYYQKYFPS